MMLDFSADFFDLRVTRKVLTETHHLIRWRRTLFPKQPADEALRRGVVGWEQGTYEELGELLHSFSFCKLFEREKRGLPPLKKKWHPGKKFEEFQGHFVLALGSLQEDLNGVHIIPSMDTIRPTRFEFKKERVVAPREWYVPEWDKRFWFLVRKKN